MRKHTVQAITSHASNKKGQRVILDDEKKVKSIVNHLKIHKAQIWSAAATGSIVVIHNTGVPMVVFKGVRHKMPEEAGGNFISFTRLTISNSSLGNHPNLALEFLV